MPEMKCTLNNRRCNTVGGCAGCGWEENEMWRRMQIRREVGLTLCEDGLKRLVVGRPREMEEETDD